MGKHTGSRTIDENDKNRFLKAYQKSLGNISASCKAAGITRASFYNIRNKDSNFKRRVEELNEFVGDYVESKLVQRIEKNDTIATIFYCKTKLQHRGYIEKSQLQYIGDKNNPICIKKIDDEDIKLIEEIQL